MIFDKVKSILMEQLNVGEERVTLDTELIKDLNADSLDIVELLMTLEEQYNITVPEEKAVEMVTVGDVVKFIEENIE
ncbi:MAG: acyl carrier protein [Clostridia bacterium]|nr:acyl carrier protein [Clostridia bacterium]